MNTLCAAAAAATLALSLYWTSAVSPSPTVTFNSLLH
jgi:hypothetical protein